MFDPFCVGMYGFVIPGALAKPEPEILICVKYVDLSSCLQELLHPRHPKNFRPELASHMVDVAGTG